NTPGGGGSEDSATPVAIGVIDLDTSDTYPGQDLSRNFTATLDNITAVDVYVYRNETTALTDLYYGFIDAYLVIPYGFEGNLTSDIPASIKLHQPASGGFGSFFGRPYAVVTEAMITFRINHGWIRSDIFAVAVSEFSAEGDSIAVSFGSFINVFVILMTIAMIASQAIVGDVPLRRVLLTPASKFEVVIAKWLAYLVIGALEGEALLSIWLLAFGIVVNTDFITLSAVTTLMAMVGSSIGVCISAYATSRLQANQVFLITLFSFFILSGVFFDVGIIDEFMPLNLGMILINNVVYKGIPLLYQLSEISRVFLVSGCLIAIGFIGLLKKKTLA
ncbi:MAG: ABC transporter permease, partial [Candidatus Ranarchaeia archaeon]